MSDHSVVMEKLAEAAELLEKFQSLMNEDVRPYFRKNIEHMYHRVDAYPGWDFNRDMGGGETQVEWLEEITDAANANRCARCGEPFEAGDEKAEVARTAADDVYDGEDQDMESVVIHASCMTEGEDIA